MTIAPVYRSAVRVPVLLAALLCACAAPGVVLERRSAASGSAAPGVAEIAARYHDVRDRIAVHAAYYERQGEKAHTKARIMSVLAVTGAATAAGTVGPAAHPMLPEAARPGLIATSVSMSAFSAVFVLVPWAHDYAAKEIAYRAKADALRSALLALDAECASALADDEPARAVLDGCFGRAEAVLLDGRRFADGSPARPPQEGEVATWLARATRP